MKRTNELNAIATLLSHPAVWRADAVTRSQGPSQPLSTGYSALDRKLSEKGWPRAGIVELQCTEPGVGELRLLVPALNTLDRESERLTIWVDPPFIPYPPALAHVGLDLGRMLVIRTDRTEAGHRNALWSTELALKSGACHAVLSWFDSSKLKSRHVRQLKLAARQGSALGVLFVPPGRDATMADLKIALAADRVAGQLELEVLKQRGGWPAGRVALTLTDHHPSERLAQTFARWRATRCLPESMSPLELDTWFAVSACVPRRGLTPLWDTGREEPAPSSIRQIDMHERGELE